MTRIAALLMVAGLLLAGCSSTTANKPTGFELTSLTCVKKGVTQKQATEDAKAIQAISGVANVLTQLAAGEEKEPRSVQMTLRVMTNQASAVRKQVSSLGYDVK